MLPESLPTHIKSVLANDSGFLLVARNYAVQANNECKSAKASPSKNGDSIAFCVYGVANEVKTYQPIDPLP